MYLLDTNVVSELRKAKTGNQKVLAWAQQVSPSTCFLSAITVMELETGILVIERRDKPQGSVLRFWFENQLLPEFHQRVLPIDLTVARRCAGMQVPSPCSDREALIAATALVQNLTVVTRNVTAFERTGVAILNPWQA